MQLHPGYAEMVRETLARTPTGRMVTAAAIADAVMFLCSPLSSAIVGQTLVLDEGAGLRA